MVQVLGLLTRVPHISFETFDDLWTKHEKLVREYLPGVKNGTIKYKQFHIDAALSAEARALGVIVPTYDGVVLWEAATLKELTDCWASPECIEHLRSDDAHFLAAEKVELVVGRFIA
ncbi:BetaGal-dom2 domain-containing protein [Mycena kentingensis (nom. inval.)]|nr:BetaGal-dom2 domain-containing protein [Mycena kentingensis (nom. inval.)]